MNKILFLAVAAINLISANSFADCRASAEELALQQASNPYDQKIWSFSAGTVELKNESNSLVFITTVAMKARDGKGDSYSTYYVDRANGSEEKCNVVDVHAVDLGL